MNWGRPSDPLTKDRAKNFAFYAFTEYREGREKAYMVESAITDLEKTHGKGLPEVDLARRALAEDDERERDRLMAQAVAWLGKRR